MEIGRAPIAQLDALSSIVPESVPRPAAKVIVGVAGFSVVALVLKSILSTALTLLVVVGGGGDSNIVHSNRVRVRRSMSTRWARTDEIHPQSYAYCSGAS